MLSVVQDLRKGTAVKAGRGIFLLSSIKTKINHCISADEPFQIFLWTAFTGRANFQKAQIAIPEIL